MSAHLSEFATVYTKSQSAFEGECAHIQDADLARLAHKRNDRVTDTDLAS